ncbi:MAG: GxxExxY protein [Pirellulaceae bacterium]|nr:GxxExxY protein [Pirellulaceae bacterium]
MPITTRIPLRRLSQAEFGELSYQVMDHVFAIRNEIGRFFDEKIYKRELAQRLPDVRLEEPVNVAFRSFRKTYFLDVLVAEGALFEFKAVESLAGRHRAQLLNYLLMCDLAHGKLVNLRTEDVEHEFVNTHWRAPDRRQFIVDTERWDDTVPAAATLHEYVTALLRDLGIGLEIALYEEAVVHQFGGPDRVNVDVPVTIGDRHVGEQTMRLIAPGVALKITGFERSLANFESHARRLLAHVQLRAIAWININMQQVTFTTLTR